jgi:hypothetical protein
VRPLALDMIVPQQGSPLRGRAVREFMRACAPLTTDTPRSPENRMRLTGS